MKINNTKFLFVAIAILLSTTLHSTLVLAEEECSTPAGAKNPTDTEAITSLVSEIQAISDAQKSQQLLTLSLHNSPESTLNLKAVPSEKKPGSLLGVTIQGKLKVDTKIPILNIKIKEQKVDLVVCKDPTYGEIGSVNPKKIKPIKPEVKTPEDNVGFDEPSAIPAGSQKEVKYFEIKPEQGFDFNKGGKLTLSYPSNAKNVSDPDLGKIDLTLKHKDNDKNKPWEILYKDQHIDEVVLIPRTDPKMGQVGIMYLFFFAADEKGNKKGIGWYPDTGKKNKPITYNDIFPSDPNAKYKETLDLKQYFTAPAGVPAETATGTKTGK